VLCACFAVSVCVHILQDGVFNDVDISVVWAMLKVPETPDEPQNKRTTQ